MNRIRHNDNDLKQLGYFGRLNFLSEPGQMVKNLFFRMTGVMLKKIFWQRTEAKIIFSGLTSFIFNFVLGIAGEVKFFIFLCARGARNNFFYPSVAQRFCKIQYSR
jgi:hypothetical protein